MCRERAKRASFSHLEQMIAMVGERTDEWRSVIVLGLPFLWKWMDLAIISPLHLRSLLRY